MKLFLLLGLLTANAAALVRDELIEVSAFRIVKESKSKKKGKHKSAAAKLFKVGPPPPEVILQDDIWGEVDFSFSMSYGHGPPTPKSPTPAPVPTISPKPTVSPEPTFVPVPTTPGGPGTPGQPSAPGAPTIVSPPSTTTTPSALVPTLSPEEELIFICTDEGVDLAELPFSGTTTIVDFTVGYLVETVAEFEEYKVALERQILETALVGALQCNFGGPIFCPCVPPPNVNMTTVVTDETCDVQSEAEGSTCTVFETSFQVVIGEAIDPQLGAFLGYVALQEEMDLGTFVGLIEILDRVEYLHPLPLFPPITGDNSPTPAPGSISSGSGGLNVSSWTLGAVIAMCIGGVVALYVWARNRRTRNERHMQLLEDVSLASPSPPEAAREA